MQNSYTLFDNGHFYLGPNNWAEALVVDAHGNIDEVIKNKKSFPSATSPIFQKKDFQNRWILPGFEDAHTHPTSRARTFQELDFRGKNISWEDAKKIIQEKTLTTPKGKWIVAHGWNDVLWQNLSKNTLDEISQEHGIFLMNISYHGGLINSFGESLLLDQKISLSTRDGFLREHEFEEAWIFTSPTTHDYLTLLPKSQERLLSLGIIAAHDLHITTLHQLEAYRELDSMNHFQPFTALYINPRLLSWPKKISEHLNTSSKHSRLMGLKIFIDGAIGVHSAAMHENYHDKNSRGILRVSFENCKKYIHAAADLGLPQVAMHCIGDRGIDFAVEIFEKLQKEFQSVILSWRFEHCEIPGDEAIKKIASLGGKIWMQPNFLWDAQNYKDRLGNRIEKINPFRKILDAKIPLAFGSDDMPLGPIAGISWTEKKIQNPLLQLTRHEAFSAYTHNGAKFLGMSDHRGKIANGYEANLVVFKKNPFEVPEDEFDQLSVLETWIRGKRVYFL